MRIGNAAHGQLQLDVFGEVMDALHQARRGGLDCSDADWAFQRALLEHLETGLAAAGRGHLGSARRAAALHLLEGDGLGGLRSRHPRRRDSSGSMGRSIAGARCAQAIHDEVCAQRLRSPSCGSFVQSYGSKELDASLLLLPTVGFLPPDDPRIRGTVDAVERRPVRRRLRAALRHRDRATTACRAGEGAFLACSFWLADAYVLIGRLDDARALFERLLALRNDVGLLAGGIRHRGAAAGRQLPAGVLAHRAGEHRAQSVARDEAGGAARGVLSIRRRVPRRCWHCCVANPGYGGRTRAATPSSAAGLGSGVLAHALATSLIPTGFSRGQAIRVGLTSTRIRHAATPTPPRLLSRPVQKATGPTHCVQCSIHPRRLSSSAVVSNC